MALLRNWLLGIPRYLWGGWGAIASLLLLVALWEALAAAYGPLVLPTPVSDDSSSAITTTFQLLPSATIQAGNR